MPKRQKIEYTIQTEFMSWLSRYPEIYSLTFHIPNQRFTDVKTMMCLKRMGVKPGIPDIFISIAKSGYHGFYIEFKADNGAVSLNQKVMKLNLEKAGYKVAIINNLEDAKRAVLNYVA